MHKLIQTFENLFVCSWNDLRLSGEKCYKKIKTGRYAVDISVLPVSSRAYNEKS